MLFIVQLDTNKSNGKYDELTFPVVRLDAHYNRSYKMNPNLVLFSL